MDNSRFGGVIGALPLGNIHHAAGHGSHIDDAALDSTLHHNPGRFPSDNKLAG